MMQRKLIELNDFQNDAVRHVWGACFVSAAPGSGKTRVIVERCARLIEEEISPRSILCLTFTNKAANEMRERLVQMLGPVAKEIYISTFHALCLDILRKYGSYSGYDKNLSVVIEDDQEALIAQISRQKGFDLKPNEISKIIWATNNARENLAPVGSSQFNKFFKEEFAIPIATDYIAKLKENNQVDFSGILSECIALMQNAKHILQKLQDRFCFLQIDEAQDTNLAQFKIVELLGEHTNVFMVGDIDQTIYSWRGSRYENISDFIKKFRAKVLHLPVNYRSTQTIVKAAGTLIKNNPDRLESEFTTVNEEGCPIDCNIFRNPDEEAAWISREIKRLVDAREFVASDFAILYRNNAMSRALEVAMIDVGLSYQVIGGFGFFDRKEIKDSLAMLRFYANPKDGLALARFINKPSRRIGQVTLGKIEKFAKDNKIDLNESMKRASEYIKGSDALLIHSECAKLAKVFQHDYGTKGFGDIMEGLVAGTDYLTYLKEDNDDSYYNRQQNLQELFTSATAYGQKKPNDIMGYLNKIALKSSADKESTDGSVTLMTIHAAKGLEFPVVFIPCMDEGSLPSHRALSEDEKNVEEERRVTFVGMTRAKKKLYMSYPASRPKRDKKNPSGGIIYVKTEESRFFAEAGLQPIKTDIRGNEWE